MALVGKRNGRNFGYGRQLSYAGPQALKDLFGGGHFATVKAHSDRWQAFVMWCRSEEGPGYNDARQIDRQTLLHYVQKLRQQIEHGDRYVKVQSPSKALGGVRSTIRTIAPQGQDRQYIECITQALNAQGQNRVSAIVHLARETGMRLREAILADLPRLQREAERLGRINIQDGTKGGRSGASAPRWIPATEQVRGALKIARRTSPSGSRNLLARNESYIKFMRETVGPARNLLHALDLKGFHELRAAYACERYEQITGHPAPVNSRVCYRQDRQIDREARKQISIELGHNRIDVASAYIGGRK